MTIPILAVVWIAAVMSGLPSPSGRAVALAVFSITTLLMGQLGLMSVLLAMFALHRMGASHVRA